MSKNTKLINDYVENLAEEARALLAATSDATEGRVREARKQLASALEGGREIYGEVRRKAVAGAKYADETVRENPYAPIGVALLLGALLVFLFTRRRD